MLLGTMKPNLFFISNEIFAGNIKELYFLAIFSQDGLKTVKTVVPRKLKVDLGDLRYHLKLKNGYFAILIDIQELLY